MNGAEIQRVLETGKVAASVPCRIDLGGTLDISTFYYPLSHLNPCTFNIAIDLRTKVSIHPHRRGYVKITSRGFEDAEYKMDDMPFAHPMGLMFAIAAYFHIDGIHIHIDSSSPPRSALGGSSSAAIALIGAYNRILKDINQPEIHLDLIPLLAHAIEESVAGVPCGLQDQLAATYGGINAWFWKGKGASQFYLRKPVAARSADMDLKNNILLAYCGIPHESKNINGQWVSQFLAGKFRSQWIEIVNCTNKFVEALSHHKLSEAADMMNRETSIRLEMTPDVLDETGMKLFNVATANNCGTRFTGAGGGGCLWALGTEKSIEALKKAWGLTLSDIPDASLLNVQIDYDGLKLE